ncbi:MAG: ABC transporter permease [Acidimicrobiia bacterium]|nr:ABC transporter permease [Acidimicrobiia bacterium]
MKIAVLELVRRPGRFVVVGGALTLLTLLLLFLGGLLDGLFLNSTGAIRANDADALVFSDDARQSFLRSTVDDDVRAEILAVDGVGEVGGLGLSLLGVAIPGEREIADGAVAGYELASGALPAPPSPGQAYADRRLEKFGARLGQTVLVGPAEVPLELIGWVEDTNYLLQNGLWVEPDTWRSVQTTNRPDAPVGAGEFQTFIVRSTGTIETDELIARIDSATGRTETLSENDAVFAVPGITEQNATFTAVIGVTIFVTGLVVALFFALLTIERQGLYALLKAIGGSSRTLVAGVVVQSLAVALGAYLLGALLTAGLAQILPPSVPAQFELGRAAITLVAVTAAAVAGGLISFRRITRIDPATAIGAGA